MNIPAKAPNTCQSVQVHVRLINVLQRLFGYLVLAVAAFETSLDTPRDLQTRDYRFVPSEYSRHTEPSPSGSIRKFRQVYGKALDRML